jgi:hypothetical protein
MTVHYQSEAEIEAVVQGFESCTMSPEAFSHERHVTVALWYLRNATFEQAAQAMRAGLSRFINHNGVDPKKYHETMTLFWLRLTASEMKKLGPQLSLLDLTNAVVEKLANSKLQFDYYNRDFLMSDSARHSWVEPDLKQLDF